jgi:hypothetical protein
MLQTVRPFAHESRSYGMSTQPTEPRRTRVATETSASDGWIARLRERIPAAEPTPALRQSPLPVRPKTTRVAKAS